MRQSKFSPSLVPRYDTTVHVVLDDFGKVGRAYVETDEEQADLESIVRNLLTGQYVGPRRVVAFNTAEGWSRDVSEDVAREVLDRARRKDEPLPVSTRKFVEAELGQEVE